MSPAATEEITYDAAGNRLTVGDGVNSGAYSINDLNQYTATPGTVTPAYNSRGDLSDFNSSNANDWEFTFDAEGHLVAAQSGSADLIQYHYDAFGDRAARQDGTDFTWFLNIGSEMLEAFDATTASATSYVYAGGIDQPVAQITDADDVEFLHQDVLGNVVLVTNESGNVLEKYTYGIWGYVSAVDAVGNPVAVPRSRFLFTGRELDTDTGLYHYRTRAYSPQIGRFLQMDSIDFRGKDLNLHRYVANNPVNWIDPYGLQTTSNTTGPGLKAAAEVAAHEAGYGSAAQMAQAQAYQNSVRACIKQAARDGKKSLEKMIRKLDRRIKEHQEKIKNNPKSRDVDHWNNEIKTWKTSQDAAKHVLEGFK